MKTALEHAEIYLLRKEHASYWAGLSYEDYLKIFEEIIYLDVASGDARPDSINSYRSHMQQFLAWCEKKRIMTLRDSGSGTSKGTGKSF